MGERSTHKSAKSQKMRHTLGPKSGADCQRNIGKRRSHAGTKKTPYCKTLADTEESSRFRPKLRVSPPEPYPGSPGHLLSGSPALRVSGSWAFRRFHKMTQRSPNAHCRWSTALNRDHTSTRRPPEGNKKREILGPSPFGSPRFLGLGAHPSAPPTHWGPHPSDP